MPRPAVARRGSRRGLDPPAPLDRTPRKLLATLGRRRAALSIVLAGAVALAACGTENPGTDAAQVRRGLEAIQGIPQDGFTLGDRDAPWTLSVFSTPTNFELDSVITELPALTERFVRSGELNVQMRTPTTGPYGAGGEERAVAGALLAAGLQGRYWNALVRFVPTYAGGGDADDLACLLRQSGVPDVDRAMTRRSSPRIRAALDRADAAAAAVGGRGRVVYALGSGSGPPGDITAATDEGELADAVGERIRRRER